MGTSLRAMLHIKSQEAWEEEKFMEQIDFRHQAKTLSTVLFVSYSPLLHLLSFSTL